MEIKNIKKEFPIFTQKINGKPLVYLDSANSSQKPKAVIDRISNFCETEYSNVGRSVHSLAVKATNRFEATRDLVKKYMKSHLLCILIMRLQIYFSLTCTLQSNSL